MDILARRLADQARAMVRDRPDAFGPTLLAAYALVLAPPEGESLEHELSQLARPWSGLSVQGPLVLQEVAARCRRLALARDEVLYREGDTHSDLYVVIDGALEVERRGLGVVDLLGPGDLFGESGLVGGLRRLATVRAGRSATVLLLNLQQADRLVRHMMHFGAWLRRLHRTRLTSQVLPTRSPLAQLDLPRRERLLDCLVHHRVPDGTRLLTQDKVAHQFGILLGGVADVSRRGAGGSREVVDRLVAGDLFGARSLLTGAPSPVTMETRGQVDYLALNAGLFVDFMELWPDVRRRLEVFVHARWGSPRPQRQVPGPAPGPASEAAATMTCPFCRTDQPEADRCTQCAQAMPWRPLT